MNTPYKIKVYGTKKCPQTTSLCYKCANALNLDQLHCKTKYEMYLLKFELPHLYFEGSTLETKLVLKQTLDFRFHPDKDLEKIKEIVEKFLNEPSIKVKGNGEKKVAVKLIEKLCNLLSGIQIYHQDMTIIFDYQIDKICPKLVAEDFLGL